MPRTRATVSAAFEGSLGAAFAAAWGRCPPGGAVLAVSGGSDSTALMHLAAAAGARPPVVTVDHRLRPDSADDARRVSDNARRLGLEHTVLVWSGPGRGNLQASARAARYRLIGDWARERGLTTIVTGHTLDDQAETVLMRLARGSGLDGLAAMRETSRLGAVTLFRPLLGLRRTALRAWLRERGEGWIEDPANEDPAFDRVRARGALTALAPLGLTAERLARTAGHMARAVEALEAETQDWAARNVTWGLAGEAVLARAVWVDLPPELRLRLLASLLSRVSGHVYRPRFDALEALAGELQSGGAVRRTLHGCLVQPGPGTITILREPAAVSLPVALADGAVWDNRWRIEGPAEPGLGVGALGEGGIELLDEAHTTPEWRTTLRLARLAVPAVWRRGRLVAVPLAGWGDPRWRTHLLSDCAPD